MESLWRPLSQNLTRPDYTILLTVSEEEQLRRFKDKEELSLSDKFSLMSDVRNKVRGLYEQIAERENWIKIDTTGRNAESVASEIKERFLE
ncbi:MAG: hypothetical protein KKB62_03475 [Nanoarchaeota archaeon]|nr:hypothetical protein [Nanoarchaeota archaeon]